MSWSQRFTVIGCWFSGFSGVVPLRFAGVFILKEQDAEERNFDDVLADVSIVVIAYVITVVDTAVAKVM